MDDKKLTEKLQRRLHQGRLEPVLNDNGACFALQSRHRCCMAEAPSGYGGASVANRKNGHFTTTLIIRQLESTKNRRYFDRRSSWWISLQPRGQLIAVFVNYFPIFAKKIFNSPKLTNCAPTTTATLHSSLSHFICLFGEALSVQALSVAVLLLTEGNPQTHLWEATRV